MTAATLPRVVRTAVALAVALLLASSASWIVHVSPLRTLSTLFDGSFGSTASLAATVEKATPLILVALAFTVAYQAGLVNLGLEGQFYLGALGAAVAGYGIHPPGVLHIAVTIVAGMVGGALWAGIPIVLKLTRNVSEIVSSLLLSYVGILLIGYLVNGPIRDPSGIYGQTIAIDANAQLPSLYGGAGGVSSQILIALALALFVAWFLGRTKLGFEIKTVGANARAARFVGVPTKPVMVAAFLVSGALAGIAGALEIIGSQYRLIDGFDAQTGFTGIVVALLAGFSPIGCVIAGVLFGGLLAGGDQLQVALNVPPNLITLVQALVIVLVLALPRIGLPGRIRKHVRLGAGPPAATTASGTRVAHVSPEAVTGAK